MWSIFRRPSAVESRGPRSSRRFYTRAIAALLVALVVIPVAIAQSRRPAALPPGLQAAARALVEGRYDEVPTLVDKLDQNDPNVVAVKARALVARGRYQEAEALLRPSAQRAASSEAALELGLLMQTLGRADAPAILGRVAAASGSNDPRELARAARATRALGRMYDANDLYRDAAAALPRDAAINTAWGDLFFETFNKAEAMKSYQAVLQEDEKYGPALLGAAHALSDENPPQAMALAQKALEVNPSDVQAFVFLAGEAIDAGKRDEARKFLEKGLAVNPSSLDAHALLAALNFVEDKKSEFDREVHAALAIAPNYGDVYRITGDVAARNYRFDEGVALLRQALELRPGDARSLSTLGLHLLRTGDEPEARRVLEASFKIDGFDLVTRNLLQMMDRLDKFITIQDRDVIVRLDRDEAPVLQDYVLSIAHQALDTLSKRYNFTPKGPILIEVFPKHDDFAVRTAGLPGMIGALGVCFGRVVVMDSPKARPGEFQWEATLWHELAHVITIQMSNQRVPRWITEGISEYEQTLARADWRRNQDVSFAAMFNSGEVIKLKDLNAAFQNPKLISMAYYQGSLVVDFLVKKFGDAGIQELMRAYGRGLDTDAALKAALHTDFDALQGEFDKAMEVRFGALRAALKAPADTALLKAPVEALQLLADKSPGSYPVQLLLGTRLREAGRDDDALKAFERAAALVTVATGDDNPNLQIAEIAIKKQDNVRAMTALQAVLNSDYDNVEAARLLAKAMKDAKVTDPVRTQAVYARITAIDPFDAESHGMLGRLALQRDDADTAIREFRAVIALKPIDLAAAHTDLAEGYLKGGKRADARKQTLAALEIAPSYERAQDLLLKLTEARP
jgi:tetratricopeptide (TPR) repeat protein